MLYYEVFVIDIVKFICLPFPSLKYEKVFNPSGLLYGTTRTTPSDRYLSVCTTGQRVELGWGTTVASVYILQGIRSFVLAIQYWSFISVRRLSAESGLHLHPSELVGVIRNQVKTHDNSSFYK